jgi:hypothetical protein
MEFFLKKMLFNQPITTEFGLNQHHVPILKVARYRAKEATANQLLLVK